MDFVNGKLSVNEKHLEEISMAGICRSTDCKHYGDCGIEFLSSCPCYEPKDSDFEIVKIDIPKRSSINKEQAEPNDFHPHPSDVAAPRHEEGFHLPGLLLLPLFPLLFIIGIFLMPLINRRDGKYQEGKGDD